MNAETFVAGTVNSVFKQQGNFEIEYILVDGDSTDRTLEIVQRIYEDYVTSSNNQNISLRVISEPDRGMYDALAKGLKAATGDFIGYINASDFFHHGALAKIGKALEIEPQTKWLTGRRSWCNEAGHIAPTALPYKYDSALIRSFFYGGTLAHIPQESTFWHRDLMGGVDLKELSMLRYAGDFYLWYNFSLHTNLRVVDADIGCFRVHVDQLSTGIHYNSEAQSMRSSQPSSVVQKSIHRLLWNTPEILRRTLGNPIRV